jgi:hypothetical protein
MTLAQFNSTAWMRSNKRVGASGLCELPLAISIIVLNPKPMMGLLAHTFGDYFGCYPGGAFCGFPLVRAHIALQPVNSGTAITVMAITSVMPIRSVACSARMAHPRRSSRRMALGLERGIVVGMRFSRCDWENGIHHGNIGQQKMFLL